MRFWVLGAFLLGVCVVAGLMNCGFWGFSVWDFRLLDVFGFPGFLRVLSCVCLRGLGF